MIYKLIECAFDFVVDRSAAYNGGFLPVCSSSSLGSRDHYSDISVDAAQEE